MDDEPPKITENDIEASSDVLNLKVGSTEEEKQRWLENYLNFRNMKKIHKKQNQTRAEMVKERKNKFSDFLEDLDDEIEKEKDADKKEKLKLGKQKVITRQRKRMKALMLPKGGRRKKRTKKRRKSRRRKRRKSRRKTRR